MSGQTRKFSLAQILMRRGKNTLPENIFVCVGAALAGTFYYYDHQTRLPENFHIIMCLLVTAVIFVTWLVCSAQSGKDSKLGFAVFTFIYWGAPYIYTIYYENRTGGYSKWLAIFNRIARALLINPFSDAGEKLNMGPQFMAAVLVLLSMLTFMGGFFAKHLYDKRHGDDNSGEYEGEYVIDEAGNVEVQAAETAPEVHKTGDVPELSFILGFGDSEDGIGDEKDSESVSDNDDPGSPGEPEKDEDPGE